MLDSGVAETTSGAMNYGRSVYGADINASGAEVVGSNIYAGMDPEIISSDLDIADALEMSLD